jgi:hypothetical protein
MNHRLLPILRNALRLGGGLLLVTGILKVLSGFGSVRMLEESDPILSLRVQHLMWIVGLLEVVIGGYVMRCKNPYFASGLLAWFSTALIIYRFGLLWIDYHRPCSCLGSLTEWIKIPDNVADNIIIALLIYITFVSCLSLLLLKNNQRSPLATAVGEIGRN